jgi:hypothetical protein
MVKKQIEVKGLTIDFELHLASHEGETAAQLQQKITKMLVESPLQLTFFGARAQGQKFERVGSLRICCVRSESSAGSVREKLLRAFPSRSRNWVEM